VSFEQREHIAKVVASDAGIDAYDDLYQDIWEKFLRYKPRFTTAAWLMAHHVRIDWARREAHRRHRRIRRPPAYTIDELIAARLILATVLERWPEKARWLWRYSHRDRHPSRDKTRAHRYRRAMTEALA
jgi:DNA-directed RNA polymerase specialized sigma24 family protein